MNTFIKSVFLTIAASSASAQNLKGSVAVSSATSEPSFECVDDERPRPVRNGQRFRFNLVEEDTQCADEDTNLYEYGEFLDADNSSACAEMCVNTVNDFLASELLGFDYDCYEEACRCLYSVGTLDENRRYQFQKTNTRLSGDGSIAKTRSKRDMYCFKLVGAEMIEETALA